MEIKGKIHEIGEIQHVTDSFRKRDMIIAYSENPQFVEYIKFEANQDRVSIFENLRIGQLVSVDFNLRGRPWTNKDGQTSYFNTLIAWRVTPLTNDQSSQAPRAQIPPPVDISQGEDEDLPF